MTRRVLLITVAMIGLAGPMVSVHADVDVNVYDDVVYLYLDKLAASRLIRTYSPNQRPLTRFAVAHLVNEARSRCEETCADGDRGIIRILGKKFAKDLKLIRDNQHRERPDFVPIDHATIAWTATNQPESPMPPGLGSTGGKVQPLLSYNYGQHYVKHANFYLDTAHYLSATPYFSAYIQPQVYTVSGNDARAWVWLWRGYVKTGCRNFEFQVGRDDVKWGPGEESLMFSSNFKGLDMIRISTPHTFRLPWVFRHIGQWRFSTFFALLGKGFSNPYAVLSAYRIDWQPAYWLDLGFDNAIVMGGDGTIAPSVATAISEYITIFSSSGTARATSNHMLGMDFTARILPLLGMEFYGKVLLEDTTRHYYLTYVNDAAWLAGLYFPKLDASRRWSLRSEFVYTGQILYRHGIYASGWSLNGKFMGYDAGSDTFSVTTTLRHQFNIDEFISGSFRYLNRLNNTYTPIFDSAGRQTSLALTTVGPKEQHYLFKVSGVRRLTPWLNAYADVGLDRVINKGFASGNSRTEFSTQIRFTFHDMVRERREQRESEE